MMYLSICLPAGLFETRHHFALLAFLGLANVYALRIILSLAIVAMVDPGMANNALFLSNLTFDTCPSIGHCSVPALLLCWRILRYLARPCPQGIQLKLSLELAWT